MTGTHEPVGVLIYKPSLCSSDCHFDCKSAVKDGKDESVKRTTSSVE